MNETGSHPSTQSDEQPAVVTVRSLWLLYSHEASAAWLRAFLGGLSDFPGYFLVEHDGPHLLVLMRFSFGEQVYAVNRRIAHYNDLDEMQYQVEAMLGEYTRFMTENGATPFPFPWRAGA